MQDYAFALALDSNGQAPCHGFFVFSSSDGGHGAFDPGVQAKQICGGVFLAPPKVI